MRKLSALIKSYIGIFSILNSTIAFACSENLGPAAIMGGQGNAPYAAFIEEDLSVAPLQGLPPTGLTYRVAINSHGYGLVGGTNGTNAYAALVSPEGRLTPVQGLIAPGEIYFVSINESGAGIVGGGHQASNVPFAAFVARDGSTTPFSGLPVNGLIYGVAIEKAGNGIIGGIGPANSAYAALTSPDGTLTPLAGLPAQGAIFWVDVNRSGTKFIGGQDQTNVYAAFVSPQGSVSPVPGLPAGLLYSVGINNGGFGIIGGSASSLPYAALVRPDRSVATIQGLPTATGIIYNVAINESGTGLLAGFSNTVPYAAFVSPQGVLRPLRNLPAGPGFVDGAALHESGVAIIGGTSANVPFSALVAPNGTLTYLSGLPDQGQINSIAIAALDSLVPRSIGPYDSLANTQFVLSETLTQHRLFSRGCCVCADTQGDNSIWLAPFGSDVRQERRQSIPTYSNHILGALLGFDHCCQPGLTLGGGLAYAFNDVHYSRHLGSTKINHESAVLYASFDQPYFYIDVALWGGVYEAANKRKSFTTIISKDKINGWTLSPHIELSKAFSLTSCERFVFEPFIMLDCANSWLSRYREKGESGFNLTLKERCISILRNEIGVRFYETFYQPWGCLTLEQKVAYANRTPLSKKNHNTSFIDAFSSFDVRTLCGSSLNNAVIAFHLECLPSGLENIYALLDYQGEFGSAFQSQTLTATIGKNF